MTDDMKVETVEVPVWSLQRDDVAFVAGDAVRVEKVAVHVYGLKLPLGQPIVLSRGVSATMERVARMAEGDGPASDGVADASKAMQRMLAESGGLEGILALADVGASGELEDIDELRSVTARLASFCRVMAAVSLQIREGAGG